jgi:hypothetical protein
MPAPLAEVVSEFAEMAGQDKLTLLLEFANDLRYPPYTEGKLNLLRRLLVRTGPTTNFVQYAIVGALLAVLSNAWAATRSGKLKPASLLCVLAATDEDASRHVVEALVDVLARPFEDQPGRERFAQPPRAEQRVRATFCGT